MKKMVNGLSVAIFLVMLVFGLAACGESETLLPPTNNVVNIAAIDRKSVV